MTTTEPEWDEQERAWMLALAAYEEEMTCPVCGGPVSECQSTTAEGRFEVGPPVRCHRRTALLQAQDAYKDAKQSAALMWMASPRE
ncbi:hypothetical protein [Corynebacterium variabile]|uniref:hypothetical protein n=1 Tax=Corynebacterium variabile TaxID=1727 RepID=UPI003F8EB011